MKLIEKNISVFNDLFFKYGYLDKDLKDINKVILEFYQKLFISLESYEKEKYEYITQDVFYYYDKDENGNGIFKKEYKSLFLRMVKKLLFDNLETCRKEWAKENLFLNLLYWVIDNISEASIVASDYLISFMSFITNNNVPQYKSEVNPNIKMGNKANNYEPNELYLNIFCKIILKCATPGMIYSKKKSPYFETDINIQNENNFEHCPKLPEKWALILDHLFFVNYFLLPKNSGDSRILCHICFQDSDTSYKVIDIIKFCLKTQFYYISNFEDNIIKACEIFSLQDGLNRERLDNLFDFDKEENGEESINKIYFENRYKIPKITLKGIYIFAQIMERYNIIFNYFEKHKDKLRWINEYYAEIIVAIEEKNNFYNDIKKYLDENDQLLDSIKREFVNKLE